jgi:hypothetical protein
MDEEWRLVNTIIRVKTGESGVLPDVKIHEVHGGNEAEKK